MKAEVHVGAAHDRADADADCHRAQCKRAIARCVHPLCKRQHCVILMLSLPLQIHLEFFIRDLLFTPPLFLSCTSCTVFIPSSYEIKQLVPAMRPDAMFYSLERISSPVWRRTEAVQGADVAPFLIIAMSEESYGVTPSLRITTSAPS